MTRGSDLFLLDDTRIQHVSTYYIMRENGEPLTRWEGTPAPGIWYIVEKDKLDSLPAA